uniref:RING-type E3 ubiquitin transferase n=1 Tax=Phasianus colchicus TaxID=9054 RepID=A0A669R8D6_PHACC
NCIIVGLFYNCTVSRHCSMCKEKRPAHSLCTSCNKWLCSTCTEEHRHSKETGDRFLSVSLKGCAGTANELPLLCPVHTQEPLKLFCETCDILTCSSCLLKDHKEHRFRHLDEALQNQRAILENVVAKVEEKKSGIQVSAKQIEDRLLEVKHLYKKVENQIKMAKMVLINEINKRTNILLEQLEKITNERKQKLEQQLQGVAVLSTQVEHVQNFVNWAVCSKNSIPFLFSKELIVFQIQRLLETNSNTDVAPPLKIRFTWDPSYWSKQLSNFGGFTMEGGHTSHPDVLLYGNVPGLQTPLYHGHCSPVSQLEPVNNQPHQLPPAAQCPIPMCCSHCLSVPHPNKAQPSHQNISPHQHFRQPSELHQQHFPLQYSMQQRDKEQRGVSQPLKPTQSEREQQSRSESENASGRTGKHLPSQQLQQTVPLGYAVVSHEAQQVHTSHSQPFRSQTALQTSTVQVQLGHLQKIKSNHVQQPPQQQQLSPASPPPSQYENNHKQVMQQSLDIMHHQFELEEMKKDLELLLQAQGQSSLQLNQAKPPQHVQQTIVGQINYIVRQPAPVQQQIEDEAQVSFKSSFLLFLVNVSSEMGDTFKISSPLGVVGFANDLEMELPSRLSRSVDPQVQGTATVALGPSPNTRRDCDTPPEPVPSYSLALGRAPVELNPGVSTALTPGDAHQGSAKCKVGITQNSSTEMESIFIDSTHCSYSSACPGEPKIPFVKLERLKICASESGELPVFKLQPQESGQEGNFLLIIEHGTQSSSMAIKVSGICLKFYLLSPFTQEVNTIENEDFCAVCLNGGELLCCDHCPKVFHLSCHVPALLSFPVGEWVCTLCRNPMKPEVEYDCENTRYAHSYHAQYGLDDYDQKKCEKLVLSLFCSSMSLPFHEPVSPLARHYYQIIKRPMDLSIIRKKLQKKDKFHYSAPEELVTDVRLMFWNCAKFNYPDSEVAEAGRCLDVFFEGKLKEIYPDRHFPSVQQDDSDCEELENQNSKMPPQDFHWPSHEQEWVQPKKRRCHAESDKTKRMTFQTANSLPQV